MKILDLVLNDKFGMCAKNADALFQLENNAALINISAVIDSEMVYKLHIEHGKAKSYIVLDKDAAAGTLSAYITAAYIASNGVYFFQLEGVKNIEVDGDQQMQRIISNKLKFEVGNFINAEYIPTPAEESKIDDLYIKFEMLDNDLSAVHGVITLLAENIATERQERIDGETETRAAIPTKTSQLTNDSGFITDEDLPAVPTKTSQLENDSGFITSEDLPTVPTKTSELENDSGFITSEALPTKTSDLENDSGFITGSVVRTVNNTAPDANGNVNVSGGGGEGTVKSVNNVQPDANGNVSLDIPAPYNDTQVKADIAQNKTDISTIKTNLIAKADKTELAKTDKSLDTLWDLNEDNTYKLVTEENVSYENIVPEGSKIADVLSIGGKSVVVNNLYDGRKFNAYDASYSTLEKIDDVYKVTVEKIASRDAISYNNVLRSGTSSSAQFNLKANHIYLRFYDIKCSKNALAYNGSGWIEGEALQANVWKKVFYRAEIQENTSVTVYMGIVGVVSTGIEIGDTYECKNYNFIDLTQMFGVGNEPTLEECKQIFTDDYYPYNEGELISASSKSIEIKGRNLFDGEVLKGYYGPSENNYSNFNSDNNYRSISMFLTKGVYTVSAFADEPLYFLRCNNDIDKAVPIASQRNSYVIDLSGDTNIYFSIRNTTTTDSFTNLRFQIEQGEIPSAYSPYREPIELPTDFGILRSAGSVYDYIDFERSVIVRRVGVVDLGSFIYSKYYVSEGTLFRATKPSDAYTTFVSLANIMCAEYETKKSGQRTEKSISDNTAGKWDIVDSRYSDAQSFKSAMQGVMLYYELATPTEEPITISDDFKTIEVEANGTITFKNDTDFKLNVPNTTKYLVKKSADISDVQIAGTSITDENKVANIPIATTQNLGVSKPSSSYGTSVSASGWLQVVKAPEIDIDARAHSYRPIVPNNLDYAVKQAMCDGKGAQWTETEKLSARQRIGVDKEWQLKGTLTMDNLADGVLVDMIGCTEYAIKGTLLGTATSMFRCDCARTIHSIASMVRTTRRMISIHGEDGAFGIRVVGKYRDDSTVMVISSLDCYEYMSNNTVSEITRFFFADPSLITECNLEIYAR